MLAVHPSAMDVAAVVVAVNAPGALGAAVHVPPVTVRGTWLLTTVTPEFVIVTLNKAPPSLAVAAGVVYEAEFAPVMGLLLRYHW